MLYKESISAWAGICVISFRETVIPSWIKSIDICSLNSNNKVVAYSEYPVTMDERTANVSFLQEKISKEAFGGSGVKLLNSKNELTADTKGSQGTCMFTCMHYTVPISSVSV